MLANIKKRIKRFATNVAESIIETTKSKSKIGARNIVRKIKRR